jgi:hypothetical protein
VAIRLQSKQDGYFLLCNAACKFLVTGGAEERSLSIEKVHAAVRELVDLISEGRYADALKLCTISRLSEVDISNVIQRYGKTFVPSSADFLQLLDVIAIDASSPQAWSIRAPLWTLEEGRSDLTLELTLDRPAFRRHTRLMAPGGATKKARFSEEPVI